MQSLEIKTTNAESFKKHESAYNTFLQRMTKDYEKSHVIPNMDNSEPSGLLYLIKEERNEHRRWTRDTGQIDLLYDLEKGSIVGVSAVEHSNLHPDYASGGNRLWMDKEYRENHNITKHLLTANLNWAMTNNKNGMILTFNEYNKLIWEVISQAHTTGKTPSSVSGIWSNWWTDCIPIENPITVHSTTQWAVIKPCTRFSMDQLKHDVKRIQNDYS
jgi:hypothetical protein